MAERTWECGRRRPRLSRRRARRRRTARARRARSRGSTSRPGSILQPYPAPRSRRAVWTRLPDVAALAELEQVAAERYGARPESVVAGPGSQALLQVLARLAPRGAVGALKPTYGGYADAFGAAGLWVTTADSIAGLADRAVAVVVEPEQPGRQDGRPRSPDRPPRVARGPGRLDDRRRGLRRFRRGCEPRARSPGEGRCRPALVRQDLWARRAEARLRHRLPRHSGAPARRPRPLGGQRPGPRDRRRGAGRFGLACGDGRAARGGLRAARRAARRKRMAGRRRNAPFPPRGGQRRGKRVPAAARRRNP